MSIEVFDSRTIWNRRGKPAEVQISKWGHIRFSVEAVNLLNLTADMHIRFVTNSNDKGIIYFDQHSKGLPLRIGMKCKNGVRLELYCRPLALKLLDFFGYKTNKTFRLQKATTEFADNKFWFILKDNIHKPLLWRKRS